MVTHRSNNKKPTEIHLTGGTDLTKKIIITFTLFLFAFLGVHSPAFASVQIGMEAQLKNEQFNLDTANVNWWMTDHWALRGDYSWNTDALGLAALYTINPGSKAALYVGLAGNDLSGSQLSPGPRTAFITGLELNLSRTSPGLSLMIEAGINPNFYLNPSTGNYEPAAKLGISVNYRFAPTKTAAKINDNDKDATRLLAKLITLEARGEPFEGQVAVAAVVLNRTRSDDFPDSVRDVIYQRGQFHTAAKLTKTVPGETALKATQKALRGSDPSHGALYFYNPATCSAKARRQIKANYRVTARIGNHVFLK